MLSYLKKKKVSLYYNIHQSYAHDDCSRSLLQIPQLQPADPQPKMREFEDRDSGLYLLEVQRDQPRKWIHTVCHCLPDLSVVAKSLQRCWRTYRLPKKRLGELYTRDYVPCHQDGRDIECTPRLPEVRKLYNADHLHHRNQYRDDNYRPGSRMQMDLARGLI